MQKPGDNQVFAGFVVNQNAGHLKQVRNIRNVRTFAGLSLMGVNGEFGGADHRRRQFLLITG